MRWQTYARVIALSLIACEGSVSPSQLLLDSKTLDDENAHTKLCDHTPKRSFTLRQIHHHGAHKFQHLHRYVNITHSDLVVATDEYGYALTGLEEQFAVSEAAMTVPRCALRDGQRLVDPVWSRQEAEQEEVRAPNVSDKQTILSFAKMAANAYARKDNNSELDWRDVGSGFNYTNDFGWENDGLRGHVFADEQNQTVVISIKGTSVPWLHDPDTTMRDIQNDNLFSSCCCAQGGPIWWKTVCDCRTSVFTCNSTCLTDALHTRRSYYWAALELYYNITTFYPGADVWMTGHSLGGVVSALLGLTFGLPTLTYEAYPDALVAARYELPTPPGHAIGHAPEKAQTKHDSHVHHYGHTADPIFMGTCGGTFSSCSLWGYALEGQCHTGKRCVYDTVNDLKWREDVRTHSIVRVIEEVLEKYDSVPSCTRDTDCVDCAEWEYF